MTKVNKLYKKAMELYCDGKLEKAQTYCEKVLLIDRRHPAALNLIGLIYYVRGNLEQAKNSWKLNYKINGNMVSKKYLEDSRQDEADVFMFKKGVTLLEELKVKQALECFLRCESSHFNSLNLWNYMAKCYMQLGKYENSIKYIEDTLKLDVENREALALKKELIDLGIMDKEKSDVLKKILFVSAALILAAGVVFGVYKGYGKIKTWNDARKAESSIESDESLSLDNFQGNINENEEISEEPDIKVEKNDFNVDTLKNYMENKDFEAIITYIGEYNVESISLNDKKIVQEAEDLVKAEGVLSLYNKGSDLMKDKDYKSAADKFSIIYPYSEGIYLKEHILFMMAASYEQLGDIEKSNQYYEEYASIYLENGAYIGQCLYSLATNNSGINDEIAKKYAQLLKDNYKNSDYYNYKIDDIISK